MKTRGSDSLNDVHNQAELLAHDQSWLERNIQRPFYEACISDIYQPASNAVNALSRGLLNKELLPRLSVEAHAAATSPASGPIEYAAQLLSRGSVGALTYAVCGRATGGIMRAGGRMAHIEGPLAKLLASESSSMIVGAGIHDFCLDAKDNRERAANVAGGVSSFTVFEALNKKLPGLKPVQKALALVPIGAIGGSSGYLARELTNGHSPNLQTLKQSAFDGAALNVLLPAAQHGTARLIDSVNVTMGRGIPLERYMNYAEIAKQSETLDNLAAKYALSRIQPSSGPARIDHVQDLIFLPETSCTPHSSQTVNLKECRTPDFESGQKLAHELSHKESKKTQEIQLESLAKLLDTNPLSARRQFIDLRMQDELSARQNEAKVRQEFINHLYRKQHPSKIEIAGHNENTEAFSNSNSPSLTAQLEQSYRRLFSNEYLHFKKAGGSWQSAYDFALLSSDELGRLKRSNDSLEIVSKLYPELSEFERVGIAKSLSEAAKSNHTKPFDLIYGMSLKAWRSALAWETIGRYLSDKLRQRINTDFIENIDNQEAARELKEKSEEIEHKRIRDESNRLKQGLRDYFDASLKALTKFANAQEANRTQAAANILERLPEEFRAQLNELELKRNSRISNAVDEYNSCLADLHQKSSHIAANTNSGQEHFQFQKKYNPPSLLDIAKRLDEPETDFEFPYKEFPNTKSGEPHLVVSEFNRISEQIGTLQSKNGKTFSYHLLRMLETLSYDSPDLIPLKSGITGKDVFVLAESAAAAKTLKPTVEKMNDQASQEQIAEAERLQLLNWGKMRAETTAAEAEFEAGLNKLHELFKHQTREILDTIEREYARNSFSIENKFTSAHLMAERVFDSTIYREIPLHGTKEKFVRLSKQIASNTPPIPLDTNDAIGRRIIKNALASALTMSKSVNRWYESGDWINTLDKKRKINIPLSSSTKDGRLRNILLANIHEPPHELENISRVWPELSENKRNESAVQPYKTFVASITAQIKYPKAAYPALAAEAARWNTSSQSYKLAERVYAQSLKLPEVFPTEKSWSSDKYTGRFLPRADVRRLFMGNHTASCMRIDGANEDGVIWTQKSAEAGFFVVENTQTGEIVAGSRVWQVPAHKAVCFNSIQAKGTGSRSFDILKIYQSAAQDLLNASNLEKVVVGTDHSKIPLQGLSQCNELVPLPSGYDGLSDCEDAQKILACTAEFRERNDEHPIPVRRNDRLQGRLDLLFDHLYMPVDEPDWRWQ